MHFQDDVVNMTNILADGHACVPMNVWLYAFKG